MTFINRPPCANAIISSVLCCSSVIRVVISTYLCTIGKHYIYVYRSMYATCACWGLVLVIRRTVAWQFVRQALVVGLVVCWYQRHWYDGNVGINVCLYIVQFVRFKIDGKLIAQISNKLCSLTAGHWPGRIQHSIMFDDDDDSDPHPCE